MRLGTLLFALQLFALCSAAAGRSEPGRGGLAVGVRTPRAASAALVPGERLLVVRGGATKAKEGKGGAGSEPAPLLQERKVSWFGRIVAKVRRWLFGGAEKKDGASKHLNKKVKRGNPVYRIQRELRAFLDDPPPNCSVTVGDDIRNWVVTIVGAENSIYAGEEYKLRVIFPKEYPTKPPSVYFLKPVPRHVHVYTNGDICLSLLGAGWRPNLTVSGLSLSILSMLSSASTKELPKDNAQHADAKPGQQADGTPWLYHDNSC